MTTSRLPRWGSGKESACQWRGGKRRRFSPWVGKIPRGTNGNQPTLVFLPGKFHGQRSLEGHSLEGCKESDTTENAHTHTHTHSHSICQQNSASPKRPGLGQYRPASLISASTSGSGPTRESQARCCNQPDGLQHLQSAAHSFPKPIAPSWSAPELPFHDGAAPSSVCLESLQHASEGATSLSEQGEHIASLVLIYMVFGYCHNVWPKLTHKHTRYGWFHRWIFTVIVEQKTPYLNNFRDFLAVQWLRLSSLRGNEERKWVWPQIGEDPSCYMAQPKISLKKNQGRLAWSQLQNES